MKREIAELFARAAAGEKVSLKDLEPEPKPKRKPKPKPKRMPRPKVNWRAMVAQKLAEAKKKEALKLVKIEPQPDLTIRDVAVIDDNGKATEFLMPVQPVTKASYERELSLHPAYADFLKNRSLDSLKLALARNDSTKAGKFLTLLSNPKYATIDISELAQSCGIGFNELIQIWRIDKLTDAMNNLIEVTPVIAQHTALDAQSTQVCCPRCDGSGTMKINDAGTPAWVKCINCSGTGLVRKVGDRASRQFVFEATGIVKSAAGVNVTVNTGAASSVESVLDEMERAIPVTGQVIDAEVGS